MDEWEGCEPELGVDARDAAEVSWRELGGRAGSLRLAAAPMVERGLYGVNARETGLSILVRFL